MRKALLVLCLLLVLLTAAACGARPVSLPESTLIPGVASVLPEAALGGSAERRETATLWFRFLDTPYLAPEERLITRIAGQSDEMALLEALFSGSGTQHPELSGLFPEGTRVRSAVLQGRTLLVTVSGEFMNQLRDEPVDWQEDPAWRVEVPLRRRLAMQALVATATENLNADEVLVLVDQPGNGAPQRLRQNWFEDDSGDEVLIRPQRRDDSLLLSTLGTARAIARYFTARDWASLYCFVSAGDAASYRDFVDAMEKLPALLEAECGGCNVTPDGQEATATVSLSWAGQDGTPRGVDAHVFRLQRESGIWKISLEQLLCWVEE